MKSHIHGSMNGPITVLDMANLMDAGWSLKAVVPYKTEETELVIYYYFEKRTSFAEDIRRLWKKISNAIY